MIITRVFLVGFMGAGKSTIGPLLSTKLGWDFVDLDEEIERTFGNPIRRIFEIQGEVYFRSLEKSALESLKDRRNCVVALGGGAFVAEENRSLVRELGWSVFLDCPLELVLTRCPLDGTRPLLHDHLEIEALYRSRLPSYQNCDFRIDVSNRTPEEICGLIVDRFLDKG